MSIFDHPDFDNHENITFLRDRMTGLSAIIAVHSTALGPAAGGTRFWQYASASEGITDALRLSRAMSLKNAMAGIPHGGGKAVILKPEGEFNRAELFTAYGRGLNRTGGSYYTAEDVGVSPADMKAVRTQTAFVAGLEEGEAASGDPSPITADGVFRCLKHAVFCHLKEARLDNLTVSIQGLGSVGYSLAEHLHAAGAKLIVADIDPKILKRAAHDFGATIVSPDEIHAVRADVFAPCALGGAVNAQTISSVNAKIICGAANNQLADEDMGAALLKRGILYCPDYVVNGGGIINVASELSGHYDPKWVDGKLSGLVSTLSEIITQSRKNSAPTNMIADQMALARIAAAR
jgi:leucine dehydrogenase